ncbi:MAG: DUF6152 family protein [Caulobacteraceae bacterium]
MLDRCELGKALLGGAAIVGLMVAAAHPALAHHSYAMFDRGKTVSISGTIRTWEMTNPHSYLWVNVKKDGAVDQVWGLEGGGTAALARAGVTKSAVKPGEKVIVDLHPLRDGRTGGMLLKLKLEDGRTISLGGGGGGGQATPGGAAAE